MQTVSLCIDCLTSLMSPIGGCHDIISGNVELLPSKIRYKTSTNDFNRFLNIKVSEYNM